MPTTISFDAVIFDMDGVILDTEKMVQESWQIVADRHGIPDIKEMCIQCLGQNQATAEKKFKEHYGEAFPYWDYKNEMRQIYWGELYGDHMPLKKGVVELLQGLKEHNVRIALATSTSRATATKELTDAGVIQYFDEMVCGDMVTHSKPDPEIFLKAAEVLGVSPNRAFAVEDSYNGIRAAHAGGLMPVMVPDMLQPNDEMREKCVQICESLLSMRDWLYK